MRLNWKRTLAVLCAAVLMLTALPMTGLEAAQAAAVSKYGVTTAGMLNVRSTPSKDKTELFKLDADVTVQLLDKVDGDEGFWYKVYVENPGAKGDWRIAYIQAKYIRELGWAEELVYEDVLKNGTSTIALGKILSEVILRTRPSVKANLVTRLGKDTAVQLLSIPNDADVDGWYKVQVEDQVGYVKREYVRVVTTGSLTAQPVLASAPIDISTMTVKGHVKVYQANVRAYDIPGGKVCSGYLTKNTVLDCVGTTYYTGTGSTWYAVLLSNGSLAYLDAGWVVPCSARGTEKEYLSLTWDVEDNTVKGYVKTIKEKVYVRKGTSTSTTALDQVMEIGTTMPYFEVKSDGRNNWYRIQSPSGVEGWMLGTCVMVVSESGTTTPPASETTPPSIITSAPTVVPDPVLGYVTMTTEKVFVRKKAGTSNTALTLVVEKETMPYYSVTKVGSVTWYQVRTASGVEGWMCGQFLKQVSTTTETPKPTATPTPTPTGNIDPDGTIKGYVTMTTEKVYVRQKPGTDQRALTLVVNKETMPYYGTHLKNGVVWYNVSTSGSVYGWMSGKFLVQTAAPSETTPPPSETTPPASETTPPASETTPPASETTPPASETTPPASETTPPADVAHGYVTMTTPKVFVRTAPGKSSAAVGMVVDIETMPYYQKTNIGSTVWYEVKSSAGLKGWMSGDFLRVSSVLVTDPPAPTEPTVKYVRTTDKNVNVRDYPDLKNSNVLTQIAKAGTRLEYTKTQKDTKGVLWYYVKVNDSISGWMISTFAAEDNGNSGNSGTANLYPAEKVDWFSGVIQSLWKNGETYTIYDVRTGKSWNARKLYGSYHADVEPATAADTAVLCEIYGVKSASQLKENVHYQRRPSLVTIGTRTFACSLYGVPHGEQSITTNNYNGQCCLHFTNSKIHDSGKVDADHQAAIQEAWERCPAGHK